MTETTQAPSKPAERAPEVAVAPLNTIDQQDVGAGAAAFDQWLRKISNDHVTLERLSTVAGSLPVIGNIMALIDAIMDIVEIIRKGLSKGVKEVDFLLWVSLGINLIGVVPVPPAMSAARMSLRPVLHLVRQKLALGVKDLGSALIEVLIVHLNARLAGEIDTFVDSAMGKLAGILDDCADTADGIADDLVKILKRCIGTEPLFEVASPAEVESKLHDPKAQSNWRRMLGAIGQQYKKSANYVAAAAASQLPQSAVAGVDNIIGHLTDFKPAFRGKLAALADEQKQMSIRWILARLRDAVIKHKRRYPALVPSGKGADHKKNKPSHELGSTGKQSPATGDPDACKLCPAKGGTARSISFATGAETFTHTDFVLDAPLPIEWSRTYRSQLIAYDRGNLGARWLTPYSTRIDVLGQGKPTSLLYHAADGRSHRYPYLGIGQRHYDPVEQITLTRVSATLLTLDFGKPLPAGEPSPWRETYELVDTVRAKAAELGKEHCRLIALHSRTAPPLACATTTSSPMAPMQARRCSAISSANRARPSSPTSVPGSTPTAAVSARYGKSGTESWYASLRRTTTTIKATCARPRMKTAPPGSTSTTATSSPATPTAPGAARTSPTTPASTAARMPKRSASGPTTAATIPGSSGTRISA